MTQVGEGIAITQVKDPEEDHWAQLEYTYPDGSPVQGMFTAVDGSGMTWTGYLNDQGQACLAGLPSGSVDYQLLPSESLEDELKDIRDQIKTVLDGILEEQRAEAKAHQEELDKQSTLGKSYSYTAAVGRGLWNGAIGLLTFAKDVVVKAGEAALFLSPVTRMNNLLQASYTSYRNGKLTWADWRQSLTKNYQDEEFKDLADLLGIDIRNLDKDEVLLIITEAYEIVAYIADDVEFRDMFIQFGKDYAGAQSSIEWAEFAGGGLFEIVLTALLLAFTGGLGNAAQIASKIRHAARLRTLGGMLRKLGKLLQRKKLNKKTQGGVDSKHKVEAEKPEGQKLSSEEKSGGGTGPQRRELTTPSKPKGGKPRGKYETPDPKDPDPIRRQNAAADALANDGYEVKMLPNKKGGNGYGIKPESNPDFLIEGNAFDAFSPNGDNVRNIWSTVENKSKTQARRVVLNLEGYTGDLSKLEKQFADWKIDTLDELLMVHKDGSISRLIP